VDLFARIVLLLPFWTTPSDANATCKADCRGSGGSVRRYYFHYFPAVEKKQGATEDDF